MGGAAGSVAGEEGTPFDLRRRARGTARVSVAAARAPSRTFSARRPSRNGDAHARRARPRSQRTGACRPSSGRMGRVHPGPVPDRWRRFPLRRTGCASAAEHHARRAAARRSGRSGLSTTRRCAARSARSRDASRRETARSRRRTGRGAAGQLSAAELHRRSAERAIARDAASAARASDCFRRCSAQATLCSARFERLAGTMRYEFARPRRRFTELATRRSPRSRARRGWRRSPPRSVCKPGLQAPLGDPLWLLARQWQFNEFQGEDAGTPLI